MYLYHVLYVIYIFIKTVTVTKSLSLLSAIFNTQIKQKYLGKNSNYKEL